MPIRRLACTVMLLLSACTAAQPPEPAPAPPSTSAALAADACTAYREAERQLEAIFARVLATHAGDAVLVARLEASQQAWLAFREAEVAAIFPAEDVRAAYGSLYPTCRCSALTALVQPRIEQLSTWLDTDTDSEGETCLGSRRRLTPSGVFPADGS